MHWNFDEFIDLFTDKKENLDLLLQGRWGLEKEFLRVDKSGNLSLTEHPSVFGDKLINPFITTDYSESQPELITPALDSVEEVYHYLESFQAEVVADLGKEFPWPMSMPSRLPADSDIPIARYGDSQEGQEKERYREYLAQQYGKKMQLVCGIHYNFSFSDDFFEFLAKKFNSSENLQDFKNDSYFALGRNFLRYKWLFIYLFGASPAVDKSYEPRFIEKMELFGKKWCPCHKNESYYLKYAMSLRMSRLGYSNTLKGEVSVSYNSLPEYVRDIRKAITDKSLINESEYYSLIRFKQDMEPDETLLSVLETRGINHVEIRALDLNPFLPLGVSLSRLYFCQVFMIFCLFEANKPLTEKEKKYTLENQEKIALSGSKPRIKLINNQGDSVMVEDWMENIFVRLLKIAKIMDEGQTEKKYERVIQRQKRKINDKSRLPSVKILKEMEDNCESFLDFGIRMMKNHKKV